MGLFTATTSHARRVGACRQWPPFSRSYGVKLPSSLAKVLPFTWVVFYQPTSVGLRYGRTKHSLEAFLGGTGAGPSGCGCPQPSRPASASLYQGVSLPVPPTRANGRCPIRHASVPLRVPPSLRRARCGAGILTCSPSTTPCGLALGPTSPGWIILPQEPLGLRWQGFSPCFHATHTGIRTGRPSTRAPAQASLVTSTLPYHGFPRPRLRRWA